MNRTLKIVGIVLVIILLAVIALPFLINVNSFRPKLESELSTALGRQVKVGNLSLSILSGSVSAEDLSIADDPAFSKDSFIRAKSLKVGVEVMPLIFSKTLHITDITLDKPEIALLRDASGKWNFSSLGGKSEPEKKPAESSSSTANLSVSKLDVKDGRLSVNRANSSIKPHVYDNVDISVRDFSLTSQFPFTMTANLPAGGTAKLDGKAGPINSDRRFGDPLKAQIEIKGLDLTASGFVEPSSGIAGVADFDGTLNSDGKMARTSGTLKADKLKLSVKGTPAGRPVDGEIRHRLRPGETRRDTDPGRRHAGQGSGQAHRHLPVARESPRSLNMKLNADGMPVDDLQAMLPALGIILPSGSKLQGGTLSVNVGIVGPVDKLVIAGPIRLAQTKLAGFNLASKMSAISALSGAQSWVGHFHPESEHGCARGPRGRAHAKYQSDHSCSRYGHGKRNHQPGRERSTTK